MSEVIYECDHVRIRLENDQYLLDAVSYVDVTDYDQFDPSYMEKEYVEGHDTIVLNRLTPVHFMQYQIEFGGARHTLTRIGFESIDTNPGIFERRFIGPRDAFVDAYCAFRAHLSEKAEEVRRKQREERTSFVQGLSGGFRGFE